MGLLAVKKNHAVLAGFLFAFSASCKLPLGLAVLVCFIFSFISWQVLLGVIYGFLPWVPFLIWNRQAIWTNTILFHQLKIKDVFGFASPLYGAVIVGLLLIAFCVAIFLNKNSEKPAWHSLLHRGLVVLVIPMILFNQTHNNHSLWVLPFLPLVILFSILGFKMKRSPFPKKLEDVYQENLVAHPPKRYLN